MAEWQIVYDRDDVEEERTVDLPSFIRSEVNRLHLLMCLDVDQPAESP